MSKKPLIGINMDYRAARKDGPAMSYLCAGYHDAIVKAGGVPVIIPMLENDEDLNRVLDLLDGVMMIGGADLKRWITDDPAALSPRDAAWRANARQAGSCFIAEGEVAL